jgi:hypothetical protein
VLGLKAKAGLLFFVCAGIFVGLVVFGNTVARNEIHTDSEKKADLNVLPTTNSLQNAIGEPVPIATETQPEIMPIGTLTANSDTNLTRNLAALIGKNIVDKNPEGPLGDNLTVMGADGMADAAITESMKNFNPAYFSPEILQSELVIDSAQSAATYRTEAEKIIMETETQTPPPTSDPVASQMAEFAKRYKAQVTALRALPVPSSLVTEHMKAIRIALGKQRIFEAVADYENDPIYAMLALKLLDTLK